MAQLKQSAPVGSSRSPEPAGVTELAEQVVAWLRAGRPVSLVRLIQTRGFSSRERMALAAFTPGEPVAGAILSSALDGPLRVHLDAEPLLRTVVELGLSDEAAADVGLSCGGYARLLVQPATDLTDGDWAQLASGEPACLVTELPGAEGANTADITIGTSELFAADTVDDAETRLGPGIRRLFVRGATETVLIGTGPAGSSRVVTSLWPVQTLVVVGGGQIADALIATADLLGWSASTVNSGAAATAAMARLNRADAVVVLSHDRAVDGPALEAALSSGVGYVGALGSARTQAERGAWLSAQGLDESEIELIHGPAGLDIGAYTPGEIALAIVAEIVAERAGTSGRSLRGRRGPIRPS